MDVVKICEVVDGCEECPKYGDDCDGKEMTREEAIKFLKLMRKAVSNFEEYGHDKASMVIECDKAEAIDMAIKALKAPQTDLISRADAIDACCRGWNNTAEDCIRNIKELPSAELPKGELVSKADVIAAVCRTRCGDKAKGCPAHSCLVIEEFDALPSAELVLQTPQTYGKSINPSNAEVVADYISRADAKQQISEWATIITKPTLLDKDATMVVLDLLPSADAEKGWRIGKPTEQGSYMVTLDSFGHKHIDLFYYGKPLMPNRKVRGKCWYRSDDEWGDVVYDDKEILAWQPLPKPYKGGDTE